MMKLNNLFTGYRGRKLRENLTAYAFIAPASILIFIFGLFPVGFALYVSLNKWRLKRSGIIGLTNYVKAIDNLAYIAVFFLAIGAFIGFYFVLRRTIGLIREKEDRPWINIISGLFSAATIFAFLQWVYLQLPEVLSIADKLRGLERSQIVFLRLLWEAFRADTVVPAWRLFFIFFLLTVIAIYLIHRFFQNPRNITYQINFALLFLLLATAIGLIYYTQQQVGMAYSAAFEEGIDPGIWPQVITVSSGVLLLLISWFVWRSAEKQETKKGFWLRVFGAMFLLVGGWLLIEEIPFILASGDKDLWQGLKVTVFFSLGTVPFQLSIALFLSILLFQKLRGTNLFRILFFIPYVTPAIASATIFKQMFSNRLTAPVNLLLRTIGLNSQEWLYEPRGIFTLFGEQIGIPIPEWAAGPSLALFVIILHSIWTYVGYNTVIYMAGLGNIPKEVVEAAEVDGANKWQVFRHITFPLLSPTTYFLSLISIIGTFKAFNTIWIFRDSLALGTTDTFSIVIFLEFFEKLRYGYASAMAFVLFAIILSLTFINNRIQGSRVFYG